MGHCAPPSVQPVLLDTHKLYFTASKQTVLLESVREVLSATKSAGDHDDDEDDDASGSGSDDYVLREEDSAAAAAAAGGGALRAPRSGALFEIKLLLDDDGHELVYDPPPAEYQVGPSPAPPPLPPPS